MNLTENDIARFWAKVDKSGGPDDCWPWAAGLQSGGYGQITIRYRKLYSHRLAFELERSKIPEGMQIDHLCRNRKCVNPAHLEVVSGKINVQRAAAIKEYCPSGHLYSGSNLRLTKYGTRRCRTCERAAYWRHREYYLLYKREHRQAR